MRIVAPSILSADFGNLERDIKMIDNSAAEWIHIDVMDGVFVPNISFGFPVMSPVRKATDKVLDVHLMIVEPERYATRFIEAGADYVTFHHEACANPRAAIAEIHKAGAKAGVSIKPATAVEEIFDYLDGNSTLERAVELIQRNTRRYAKRQLSYWGRDKDIRWLEL